MHLFARNLRNDPTDAEYKLWHQLQDKKLSGYRFRRQHPIPPYIVDFCCLEKKLVVELDGGHHADDNHRIHDQQRDEFLKNKNFYILRFWNNEVMTEIDGVLNTILHNLETVP